MATNEEVGYYAAHLGIAAADLLLSSVVVAPVVVIIWRGTWELLDLADSALFPPLYMARNKRMADVVSLINMEQNPSPSNASVYLAATLILRLTCDLLQYHIGAFVQQLRNNNNRIPRLLGAVILRLFTLFNGFTGIAFWRAIWYLLDDLLINISSLLEEGETNEVIKLKFRLIVMCVSLFFFCSPPGCVVNLLASPLVISQDEHRAVFSADTLWHTASPLSTDGSWLFYSFDVFVSLFVVQTTSVVVWWSTWELEDNYLMPTKPGTIPWDSVVLGYSATLVTFIGQYWILQAISAERIVLKWTLSCLFIGIGFMASLNVWRGLWAVADHYLPCIYFECDNFINGEPAPNATELSISLSIGILLILLLQCSNQLTNRGINVLDLNQPIIDVAHCHFICSCLYSNQSDSRLEVNRRHDEEEQSLLDDQSGQLPFINDPV